METPWDVKLHCDNSQEDAEALVGHPGVSHPLSQPPQRQGLYSPLQFLAILNMLAALVYISQASSTLVLPLKRSERAPDAGPERNTGPKWGLRAEMGFGMLEPPRALR